MLPGSSIEAGKNEYDGGVPPYERQTRFPHLLQKVEDPCQHL
jgi:hypothetical protein